MLQYLCRHLFELLRLEFCLLLLLLFSSGGEAVATEEEKNNASIVIGVKKTSFDDIPAHLSISLIRGNLAVTGKLIDLPKTRFVESRELLPGHTNYWRRQLYVIGKDEDAKASKSVFGVKLIVPTFKVKVDVPFSVSFIHSQEGSTKQMCVYSGKDTKEKWREIIELSKKYEFAEPEGSDFGDLLKRFPNSSYGLNLDQVYGHLNNSCTYVYTIAQPVIEKKELLAKLENVLKCKLVGNLTPVFPVQISKEPLPEPRDVELLHKVYLNYRNKISSCHKDVREKIEGQ